MAAGLTKGLAGHEGAPHARGRERPFRGAYLPGFPDTQEKNSRNGTGEVPGRNIEEVRIKHEIISMLDLWLIPGRDINPPADRDKPH
jgi:hypothetical protein